MTYSFITGRAGTGKTTIAKQRAAEQNLLTCSTTGISAVNLDTRTINSVLRYFDSESLEKNFIFGHLGKRIAELHTEYRGLLVDEVSMLGLRQFETICQAFEQHNSACASEGRPLFELYLV